MKYLNKQERFLNSCLKHKKALKEHFGKTFKHIILYIEEDTFYIFKNYNRHMFEERKPQNKFATTYHPIKKKFPRNAPCPCGSGKKYKHCCIDN